MNFTIEELETIRQRMYLLWRMWTYNTKDPGVTEQQRAKWQGYANLYGGIVEKAKDELKRLRDTEGK